MTAERVRTPAEEHRMAEVSALYVVEQNGVVDLRQVMRSSGLCEIRAKKALEDLTKAKVLERRGALYLLKP